MRWISLLLVALLTACATNTHPSTDDPPSAVGLVVTNESDMDATVYAYRMGQRYRLGFVVAHTTTTLRLPLVMTEDGEAQLLVHRIGESDALDYLSNTVEVTSGEHPVLYLNPDVQSSSLAVFPDR
jgi:hypothetical protein